MNENSRHQSLIDTSIDLQSNNNFYYIGIKYFIDNFSIFIY